MDTSDILKIETFKSGHFVFSRKHQAAELERLLIRADVLYSTLIDLPILPGLASQLEETLIRRSIFGTAALEGNPLNEAEVSRIIQEDDSPSKSARAEQEIRNLKRAYALVRGLPAGDKPAAITEPLIKQIHELVTGNIDYQANAPGVYRNHSVQIGDKGHGGIYTPPKCLPDIAKLMEAFAGWINSPEIMALNPYIRAALAHYHLGLIHPFGDGNGRVARILEAILLRMSGTRYIPTMLSNYYYRRMDDYSQVFSTTRKNAGHDVTPFLAFVLDGAVNALEEIKGRIVHYIRLFTLRDFCASLKSEKVIVQRQHDLLILLLDYDKAFTLPDLFKAPPLNALYRNTSERTARRDLKRLIELNLLTTEGEAYRLNLAALG